MYTHSTHRDKLECALKLFEKGASLKDIAKSCKLSLAQVSDIGKEYNYYVKHKKYFQGLLKELRKERHMLKKEVTELKKSKEKLSESVKELKDMKRGLESTVGKLSKKLKDVLTNIELLCMKCKAYNLDKHLENTERWSKTYINDLREELEAVISPEIIKDLKNLREATSSMNALRQREKEVKEELRRVEVFIYKLNALMLSKGFLLTTIATLQTLSSMCGMLEEYHNAKGEGIQAQTLSPNKQKANST